MTTSEILATVSTASADAISEANAARVNPCSDLWMKP